MEPESSLARPEQPAATPGQPGLEPVEMVLPLVVRIERDDPPTRTDALEAAARAVLYMLTTEEPQWRYAVATWDGHRIRKVVRRARGGQWRRAVGLPGLTVEQGTAQVRVYPPIGVDSWPRDLARLQVGGTDLDDLTAPATPAAGTPVVLMSPHVRMSAGKAMAQAGHAAQLGWRSLGRYERQAWSGRDFELAVRTATDSQWHDVLATGAPVVRDAGYTEVEPDSETAAILL